MTATADLDALLVRLRAAGLRVGIEETLRASYLLARLQNEDGTAALADVLRALLAKSAEASQQFDEVFAAWAKELLAQKTPVSEPRAPPPQDPGLPPGSARPERPRPRPCWRATVLLGVGLGVGLGVVFAYWLAHRTEVPLPAPPRPPDLAAPALPKPSAPMAPTRVWQPSISFDPIPLPAAVLRGAGLAGLGLGLGLLLFLRLRKRRYLPRPEPLPTRPGPRSILPVLPLPPGGFPPRLLDVRSQEALVWGIGRFVSEQPTRRLDIPASVTATAAHAGVPTLRFVQARHSREVWLWLDESAAGGDHLQGPALRRLSRELSITLRQGGLPVEEALYWGLPDRLTRLQESGHPAEEFAPSEVDERRDAALVVLLTDGRLLVDALASGRQRAEVLGLLRQLAHFPRLCFCDVSRGAYGLAGQLVGRELLVLWPEQIPTFLAGAAPNAPTVPPDGLSGDLQLWAAACALSPFPIEEETMFWVHDRLGLDEPGWAVLTIKQAAQPVGERYTFAPPMRAQLLSWLRLAEPLGAYTLRTLPALLQPTLLGRSLVLWRERLQDEDERRSRQDAAVPWHATPAEQYLRMQQALLDLWDQPVVAAQTLYALYQGALREELTAQLSDLGPADLAGHPGVVVLPWRLRELPALSQLSLLSMGLGGGRLRLDGAAQPQRPSRLLLAWAGCAGLLVGGLGVLGQGVWQGRSPQGEPVLRHQNKPPEGHAESVRLSSGEYNVRAFSATAQESRQAPAGSQVLISWALEDRDPPDGGAVADLGSDLGADLGPDLASPPDSGTPGDLQVPPDLLLPPPPPCPYQVTTEPRSGVQFVRVCAGEFEMGSQKGDKEADDDEKWPHRVKLEAFWIGKYEVSNEQYRKLVPGHKSTFDGDNLPVQDVSWDEARAYCQKLSGDLPTEAEWEYAARGTESRKYPWGNAAPQPGRATFSRSYDQGPEDIAANPKGRGPFGTLNQAGNVWEWVADCYQNDIYKKRKVQSDKTTPPTAIPNPFLGKPDGCRRALRGGSFLNVPRVLRSAVRNEIGPEVRNWVLGFRCVRGSRRQP